MSFLSPRSFHQTSGAAGTCRTGMIAVGEVMVVLVSLVSLFWLGSHVWPVFESDSLQPVTGCGGCSEHCVYKISLEQDGQKMWVYRPRDGIVRLDLESGQIEQSPSPMGLNLSALAQSRDGTSSLLCGQDNSVLWCRNNDVLMYRDDENVQESQDSVQKDVTVDAALSSDGGVGICVTSHGSVRGWLRRGRELHEFSYKLPSDAIVVRMALSNSGCRMCLARDDGTVTFYKPETGIPEADVLRFGTICHVISWSEDERSVALAGDGGLIRLYDAGTLNCLWEARLASHYPSTFPTAITMSPNGRWIAVASNSFYDIFVCAVDHEDSPRRLKGHEGIVRTMQFSPDSKSLYSGSYDGSIREWSSETWTETRVVD